MYVCIYIYIYIYIYIIVTSKLPVPRQRVTIEVGGSNSDAGIMCVKVSQPSLVTHGVRNVIMGWQIM
jgi:hypothetical protein